MFSRISRFHVLDRMCSWCDELVTTMVRRNLRRLGLCKPHLQFRGGLWYAQWLAHVGSAHTALAAWKRVDRLWQDQRTDTTWRWFRARHGL